MPSSLASAELVLDVKNATGECPVWHAQDQALYWVDIPQKSLYRYSPATGRQHQWTAPEMLACITRGASSHQWFAGAQTGMFELDTRSDDALGFRRVASVPHTQGGMRFNDGRCDRQGRFLAGTMVMDMAAARPAGSIYRLEQGGSLEAVLNGFVTPNGMAFSPDGRTMYLSDSNSAVRKVWAYDYDTERGLPSNPRPFIDMAAFLGRPDGAAMDTDGCYWICGIDAGLVHRYTPQGRLDRSIAVPVKKPTMCAFGGADLRTLYVASIRPTNTTEPEALDGGLFAIHLSDVQGLSEPVCTVF